MTTQQPPKRLTITLPKRYCANPACKAHGVDMPDFKADCIMEQYAAFCGEWSDYHESYKWQPLGGGHDALSDCKAALATLHEMAAHHVTEAGEMVETKRL